MKRKMIEEAVQIPSSAKRKGQNLIKGIEELYKISETNPNDWLQMYDENDWSFYIKDYKFNDKNMTFTWKEKSGELHNDRSVSDQKEKFVANGEFDFYGEFNDFVNYWNKLVRKTKKYYEMDSRELDKKLGYDVDDDELEESKKVVKENKGFSKIVKKSGDWIYNAIKENYMELNQQNFSDFFDVLMDKYENADSGKEYKTLERIYNINGENEGDYENALMKFTIDIKDYIKQNYGEQIAESKKVVKESKRVVKESNENMDDLAQEIFNETKQIMYNRSRGQRGTPFTVNTFVYQYMKNPKFHKFQVEINASLAEGLGIDSDYLTYEQSIFYKSFNVKFDEDRFKDMISDYLDNEVEEGVLICDNDNRIKEYYAV